MNIDRQQHRTAATNLYSQRQQSFATNNLPSITIAQLEKQLITHLQVLSQCAISPEITQEADLFILIATGVLKEKTNKTSVAKNYLVQFPEYHAAIFTALSLIMDDNEPLLELYQQQPGLRISLWQFWHEYGIAIPCALINQAESDANIQIRHAAIIYAADDPQTHLELFQAYYTPPSIIHSTAIWGGLVRDDEKAIHALCMAITAAGEITENNQQRFNLMRLAALTGNKQFLPILHSYAESEPALGLPLLELFSRIENLTQFQLFRQALETAGLTGRDYQALLAIALKKPLGIGSKIWQFQKQKILHKLFLELNENTAKTR